MCHYRDIADVEVIQKNQTVSHENDDHDFDRPDDIYLVEFYLYVMLSTENRESLRIPFIFQKTLKESVLGRRAIQDSNTIKRWLRDAMHEPDRETAFADDAEIDEVYRNGMKGGDSKTYKSESVSRPKQSKAPSSENKVWLIPYNKKYYDLKGCYDKIGEVYWTQHCRFQAGDTGYIYGSSPESAIRFSFRIKEADMPFDPIMDQDD
jgi:hypothetical protein